MVTSTKTFRGRVNKRGDKSISGPRLISVNALSREGPYSIESGRTAAFQNNQRSNAKATSAAGRQRPSLDNARPSAGQVKIFYLPPSQDAAIGVAIGSPNQEYSFEPSRPAPVPRQVPLIEDALHPSARSESVPEIRPRPSKWRSFGSFFGKRSNGPAARSGRVRHASSTRDPMPDPILPASFPRTPDHASSSLLPSSVPEEDEMIAPGPTKRPNLARGASSSIAAPQQVQASDKEQVNHFLPGLPDSVQAATADLMAMSKGIQEEKLLAQERRHNKRPEITIREDPDRESRGSTDRKDSLMQTSSEKGNDDDDLEKNEEDFEDDQPSPLPPPKDEGYLAKKPNKPIPVEYEHNADLDTMKEVVSQEIEEPISEKVVITVSSKEMEELLEKTGQPEGKKSPSGSMGEKDVDDGESFIVVEAKVDAGSHKELANSRDSGKGPWLDIVIPRIEMERYSIMFGSVLKRDGDQDVSQGLPQGLLERRQAHLSKLQAVLESAPQTKEPDSTPKAKEPESIPQTKERETASQANGLKTSSQAKSLKAILQPKKPDTALQAKESATLVEAPRKPSGFPVDASPSLFPRPLKPTKSTIRPKPRALSRAHTSPHLTSPKTGTFLNADGPLTSPRSWSDDNILLITPSSRHTSFSSVTSSILTTTPAPDSADLLTSTLSARSKPLEPEWEMMSTPASSSKQPSRTSSLPKPPPTSTAERTISVAGQPPRKIIGLPSSVRPVRSGVYTARRAEIANARAVSFLRPPPAPPGQGQARNESERNDVVPAVVTAKTGPQAAARARVRVVDAGAGPGRQNSQVGRVEGVKAA
ncbi:MAG: hypothetical protein M1821_001275 [Bathelium mastoideum]|nr:MAG: hypothetical protein M1821_001275 [Bathelium mastoideum]